MKKHVCKALSGLVAFTTSQLQPKFDGARRRVRSSVGVVCALSAMLLAMSTAPQARAIPLPYILQQQIALTGAATSVPIGVAVDASGNIYVSDSANNVVEEINPGTHAIATLGVSGLSQPQGLVLDTLGNLWIADFGNQRIVEWNLAGQTQSAFPLPVETTGGGPSNDWGDILFLAVDSNNNVFGTTNYSCADYCSVVEVPVASVNGTTATVVVPWSALETYGSSNPSGIAFDSSSNMYIADSVNGNVTEFTEASSYNTTSGSTFLSGISLPYGIGFDASQNFIVASPGAGAVIEYTQASGYTTQVTLSLSNGFDGDFYQFALYGTIGAQNSKLYITEPGGAAAIDEDYNGYSMTFGPVSGGSSSTQTVTFTVPPAGFTLGTPAFQVLTQGATGLDFQAASGGSCAPGAYVSGEICTVNVTFSPQAPGTRLGAVELLDNSAPQRILATMYLTGVGQGPLAVEYPGTPSDLFTGLTVPLSRDAAITTDANGDVFVADTDNNRVVVGLKANLPGCSSCTILSGPSISLPEGVAVDGAGNLYITSLGTDGVVQELLQSNGTYVQGASVAANLYPGTLSLAMNPWGIALDGAGDVYITDISNNLIIEAPAGDLTCATPSDCTLNIASNAVSSATLNSPEGIALDASGDIYIADTDNKRVIFVPSSDLTCATSCTLVAGSLSPTLDLPEGVALDPAGNVYIADYGRSAVDKVLASDLPCTTALDCTLIGTGLHNPSDVALDGAGNVYIADTGNSLAVEVNVNTPAALSFPTTTTIPSVDTTDGELTVTFTNIGDQALTYSVSPANNPSYSSGFNYDPASSCADSGPAGPLAINASCTYGVEFQPQGPDGGAYSGSIVLSDNGDGASQVQTIATLAGESNTTVVISLQSSPSAIGASLGGGGTQTIAGTGNLTASATTESAGIEYGFSSWDTGTAPTSNTDDPYTVPDVSSTYTATYTAIAYQLTVQVDPASDVTCLSSVVSGGGYDAPGSSPTISVTPNPTCQLVSWSGTSFANSANDTTTLTSMPSAPTTVKALLDVPPTYTITVTSNEAGSGVTVSDSGTGLTGAFSSGPSASISSVIDQTTALSFSTTTPQFSGGVEYGLNASSSWTGLSTLNGSSQTVTPTSSGTYTANFTVTGYQLTLITDNDSGVCSGTATPATGNYYAIGASVPLTATPSAGCYFSGWTTTTGAVFASAAGIASNSVAISAPETITANFLPIPYYVVTVLSDDPSSNGSQTAGTPGNCTAFTPSALPATGFPPTTGLDANCSLRDAVTAVENNNGGAGYISWSASLTGTTYLESALPNIAGLVTITGPGAVTIDVDGDNTYRVFNVAQDNTIAGVTDGIANGTSVAIGGVTISNGNATIGAGVYVNGGTALLPQTVGLSNLVFSHNQSTTTGGGLNAADYANVTLSNSSFSNNIAATNGGAAYSDTATAYSLTVNGVTFSKDTAGTDGGGIYQSAGDLAISNSTFNQETAATSGGALYLSAASATVGYSTFFQNVATAQDGGAIYNNAGSAATVNNITVDNNNAPSDNGGGIYNNGTLSIIDSIVANNSSKGDAGIDSVGTAVTQANYVDYSNNIETLDGLEVDCFRCTLGSSYNNNSIDVTTVANPSPNLATQLANNGSTLTPPTQTLMPLPSSAAICSASGTTIASGDQRGLPVSTTYSTGACYDIGAVQTNYSLTWGVEPPQYLDHPTDPMTPTPSALLTESGNPLVSGSVLVSLTDDLVDLTTTPQSVATSTVIATAGQAVFTALTFTNPVQNDYLIATVNLNPNVFVSGTPTQTVATSSTFYITRQTPVISLALAPSGQAYGPGITAAYLNSVTATATLNGASTNVAGSAYGTWNFTYELTADHSVRGTIATGWVQGTATNTTTYLNVGVYTITAEFVPSTTDLRNTRTTATYTVTIETPTDPFTPLPPAYQTYSVPVQASALDATFTATISGNPVTLTNGGSFTTDPSCPNSSVGNVYVTTYGCVAYTATLAGGTVPYNLVPGTTILTVGSYTLTATFTPNATWAADLTTASASASYQVTQATPTFTPATWAPGTTTQPYGQTIPTNVLNEAVTNATVGAASNLVSVPGTFHYTATNSSAQTVPITTASVLPAGSYTLGVNFIPTDTTDFASVSTTFGPYVVNQTVATVTYTPGRTSQVYGTTVPASVFDATATYNVLPSGNTSPLAGTFTYITAGSCTNLGSATQVSTSTVLAEGSYTITACFVPSDSTDFSSSSASTSYTVTTETPTLSLAQATQPYGPGITAGYLSSATATAVVSGSSVTVPGTWVYSAAPIGGGPATTLAAGTVLTSGVYTVTATFTPNGTAGTSTAAANFVSGGTVSATYTVNVVTPFLTYSPTPTSQTFGTAIPVTVFDASAANLNVPNPNGAPATNPIPGTFTYTTTVSGVSPTPINTSTVLPAGSYLIVATFTPTDTVDYVSAGFITAVYTVTDATPTANFIPVPATQVYGTPITGTGAGTSLDANFFYPAGTNINAFGIITYTAQASGGPVITLIPNSTILPVGTYILTASFAPNPNTSYNQFSVTATYTVTKNTPALTFAPNPASQVFGTPITAGSLDAVATSNGVVISGTTTYTTNISYPTAQAGAQIFAGVSILPTAAYTITASFVPTDTNDFSSISNTATYTVTAAPLAILLTSSASPIFTQNLVTFTAAVSASPLPANDLAYLNGGTVNFLDGSNVIGSGTITNGIATFTTSSATALPVGSDSITAVYVPGTDPDFQAATSNTFTEVIDDFNFTITVNSLTMQPGNEAVINLTVAPVSPATSFPANIALTLCNSAANCSVTGLPSGATYSFNPQTILAGAGSTPVVLTINVPATTTVAKAQPASGFPGKLPVLAFALLLLPFTGRLRKNSKRLARMLSILLLVIAGITASIGLSGCGSSVGGYFGQNQQTYTLTVTGTSGTLSHSTNFSLTVE